jgi:carboxylesterase type B
LSSYRLNIFGFPNAAALGGRNLNPGFLDQRKAVEWLYYNIAAFGGDPTRMVLWGQSAGAASVDKYAYAWNDDPLVRGFILDSGTADGFALGGQSVTNFTYVGQQLNCTQQDQDALFKCMQSADANAMISILNTYNATAHGGVSLSFGPVADNQTSFSNYTDRRARGLFSQLVRVLFQVMYTIKLTEYSSLLFSETTTMSLQP